MRAMVLEKVGLPLQLMDFPMPEISADQLLIKVQACGVCRTDLHIRDGELPHPNLPLILGHQIVGIVEKIGKNVSGFHIGQKVGIPWLGGCCNACEYCLSGRENLCNNAQFTGYQLQGGFAEYCAAKAEFCFVLPHEYSPLDAAPLLCGGLIGYRAYKMAGEGKKLGFYGFGSAASLLIQVARYQEKQVYVFTRRKEDKSYELAQEMGAYWVGVSGEMPPDKIDAAIIFAPSGELVPEALKVVDKGGIVVCAGIHMSDIPSFPYALLYNEKMIRSVTNLTRKDGKEFLALAPKIPIHSETHVYPLEKANQALDDLKQGRISGSAVIEVS